MRRTKIVATIGPSSRSRQMVERLIAAGMNVARVNLSHGEPAEHAAVIGLLREAAARQGVPLTITAGIQAYRPGTTNLIKAHVLG